MTKRLGIFFLVLMLMVTSFSSVLAEGNETFSFSPVFAPIFDQFDSAGKAVGSSSTRETSAAVLMLDFIFYQTVKGYELEKRALWNDCIIGRNKSILSLAYDLDDNNVLLLIYNTVTNNAEVGYFVETSLSIVKAVFENNGCSTVYTVDGDEWTDIFQEYWSILKDNFADE